MKIQIRGGVVYDPKNQVAGEKKDIFVENGSIVGEFSNPDKVIHATGKTVVPGGIDIHSHIATHGLNLARFFHHFYLIKEIGHIYAEMGYIYVNEPLMTLPTASHVHHELSSIPLIDTSALLVLDLRDLWRQIKSGKKKEIEGILLHLIRITKAIGLKIYFPFVKYESKKAWHIQKNISARKSLNFFSELDRDKFPKITLHTYPELLCEEIHDPSIFHFAHIGSGIDSEEKYNKALELLDRGATADLGLFDFEQNLRVGTGQSESEGNFSVDIGLQRPLVFSKEKLSIQTGAYYAMKLALEADISRICFSSDSPSGASFYSYPRLFSWLMSAKLRPTMLGMDLPAYEYSISDLVRVTRLNPAQVLGLSRRGHLGIGADADIAIYDFNGCLNLEELEEKLGHCQFLLKGGRVIIDDFETVEGNAEKKTYCRRGRDFDDEILRDTFRYSSLRHENLRVDEAFTNREVEV